MAYGWHDLLGNIGVVMVLALYFLLQSERIQATSRVFSAANALGALLIIVSLIQQFNLSAFIVELAWLLISLYGLARNMRRTQ
ncbi:MAG TPA: permease [Woeseiaceae bacterium]|nr:permease [Woeseiaceae bacterium]